MPEAKLSILSEHILQKCYELKIEVYVLKNSKKNTIAFTSHNRRRREFEIVFLNTNVYRVSTRFLGYRNVFADYSLDYETYADPDGRRKGFCIETDSRTYLNQLICSMLCNGYTDSPQTELI